jgi:hypothetical protein
MLDVVCVARLAAVLRLGLSILLALQLPIHGLSIASTKPWAALTGCEVRQPGGKPATALPAVTDSPGPH